MAWLFLNARGPAEEQAASGLGNESLSTPATLRVKKITDMLEAYLRGLGAESETACKVACSSLVRAVKQLYASLTDAAQESTIGADALMNLGRRTNEYFTLFTGCWLRTDAIASHFVFELGGFEFLLDTIGKRDEGPKTEKQNERQRAEQPDDQQITSGGGAPADDSQDGDLDLDSDIFDILAATEEEQGQATAAKSSSPPAQALPSSSSPEKEPERPLDEPPQLVLSELAGKQLVLTDENSGSGLAPSHSKVDWASNRRGYKSRLMIVPLTGTLRNEHWILFQLPQPALLKEIQVGFTNYWGTVTEACATPLSVVVQAGLERHNLTTVCSLELTHDDGFGSVAATVFGKNLHSFRTSPGEAAQSIESLIQSKLASLQNFQASFIKISMRRHVLCCLENSPLAARTAKRPAFAINYISLLGYKLQEPSNTLARRTQNYLASEQKKTALEVLSKICSGNFPSVLRVIANQKDTNDKIKA